MEARSMLKKLVTPIAVCSLSALVFASSAALAASSPPRGQADRYVIPFFSAEDHSSLPGSRSDANTAVVVYNNSDVACPVAVRFASDLDATSCLLVATLPARNSTELCGKTSNIVHCDATCGLPISVGISGHAYVSSSNTLAACGNIAVDAKLLYAQFDSAGFTNVTGVADLQLVRINLPNNGD